MDIESNQQSSIQVWNQHPNSQKHIDFMDNQAWTNHHNLQAHIDENWGQQANGWRDWWHHFWHWKDHQGVVIHPSKSECTRSPKFAHFCHSSYSDVKPIMKPKILSKIMEFQLSNITPLPRWWKMGKIGLFSFLDTILFILGCKYSYNWNIR